MHCGAIFRELWPLGVVPKEKQLSADVTNGYSWTGLDGLYVRIVDLRT